MNTLTIKWKCSASRKYAFSSDFMKICVRSFVQFRSSAYIIDKLLMLRNDNDDGDDDDDDGGGGGGAGARW